MEHEFQNHLIKEIQTRLPGCMIFKTDPRFVQGTPDLVVLFGRRWAALECKQHSNSKHRPNQDYYVNALNEMSFAAFVNKENKEDILDAMEHALRT